MPEDSPIKIEEVKPKLYLKPRWFKYLWLGVAGVVVLSFLVSVVWLLSPPGSALPFQTIQVDAGDSVSIIAGKLRDKEMIRSARLFRWLMVLSRSDKNIVEGIYLFRQPKSLPRIVMQFRQGDFGVELVRVFIPEGSDNRQIAKMLTTALPGFDSQKFLDRAAHLEGRLFPETYFLSPLSSVDQIIDKLHTTYLEKIAPLAKDIANSGRTEMEIIIMASLIEEEASPTSRKMISGILWKRVDDGQRLQVDAVFPYLIGVGTYDLTKKDLSYDSPYNTYRYAGLPPGPITNPGIASIKAAIYPEKSPYWFYLSDRQGRIYYARDFEEHKRNKRLYMH